MFIMNNLKDKIKNIESAKYQEHRASAEIYWFLWKKECRLSYTLYVLMNFNNLLYSVCFQHFSLFRGFFGRSRNTPAKSYF